MQVLPACVALTSANMCENGLWLIVSDYRALIRGAQWRRTILRRESRVERLNLWFFLLCRPLKVIDETTCIMAFLTRNSSISMKPWSSRTLMSGHDYLS